MTLEQELDQVKAENVLLKQRLDQALERIAVLEAQLRLNSHNSSKPPASDGFKRPAKKPTGPDKNKKATPRKAGAQIGHQAHNLSWNDQPDKVVEHHPAQCQHCHSDLAQVTPSAYQSRQVLDLPSELKLQTVEHHATLKICPACRKTNQAAFPDEVKGWVQYGPTLRGVAVYFSQVQLLPYGRTCEVLNELFAATVSEGSLYQMLSECYDHLAEAEQTIRQGLLQAEVVHNDETGLYVEGFRRWLHVMCTGYLTFYAFHLKRGKAATDAIGLLPQFKGTSVHDAWASYFANQQCQHALCNAHHLRELIFVAEELGQLWAKALIDLLLALKAEIEQAKAVGASELSAGRLTYWEERYQALIEQGHLANPPPEGGWPCGQRGRPKQSKAKNLVARLDERRREALAFAYNFKVPFDNNQAERDLRMVKVQQKVSSCFRSQQGATFFCRIRSYISTMRKQGVSAFEALQQAFRGQPLLPALPS
jgi:transposase